MMDMHDALFVRAYIVHQRNIITSVIWVECDSDMLTESMQVGAHTAPIRVHSVLRLCACYGGPEYRCYISPSLRSTKHTYCDGLPSSIPDDSPVPNLISPTLNLVQPCFALIVLLYPFLLFILNLISCGLRVCSRIVNSHSATSVGIFGNCLESQSMDLRRIFPSAEGARMA